VLTQSLQDLRVLIIDDASPDDTAEVAAALAREDPRVEVVSHSENRGHIATYNEGIEWASGDYLLLLSADDYLTPGALQRAASFMDTHPDVGLTYGRRIEFRPGDPPPLLSAEPQGYGRQIWNGADFVKFACATGRNLVPTATVVVRTAIQKALGGYRRELPHAGDFEMWLRFAAHGPVAMIDVPQAVQRIHDRNMSKAYYAAITPDYRQKKLVFDLLFERFPDALPEGSALKAQAGRVLAEQAFWTAVSQFCRGNPQNGRQLLEFSLSLCPHLKYRPPLARLFRTQGVNRKIESVLRAFGARIARRARDRWPRLIQRQE
jgi:hypothetical protein